MIIDKYFNILNKYEIINYSINEKNVVFMNKLVDGKFYNEWDIEWWKYFFNDIKYFKTFIIKYKLHREWNINIWDDLMNDKNIYDELCNVLINDNNINEWSNIDTFKAAIKYINDYKWFENNIVHINDNLSSIINESDKKWFEDNKQFIDSNFELTNEDNKLKLIKKNNNFNGGYYKFNRYLKYIDFN